MIRFVLRFIGLFILAGGFVATIYDGTKSIAGNKLVITPFADLWRQIHPASLSSAQALVEQHALSWIWDPVAVTVLAAPASLVLGILGAALVLLGRRKRRPDRYGLES